MGTCCHCICCTEFMTVVGMFNFLTQVHKPKLLLLLRATSLCQRLDISVRGREILYKTSDDEALI